MNPKKAVAKAKSTTSTGPGRKRPAYVIDLTNDENEAQSSSPKRIKSASKKSAQEKDDEGEKRLRRWRSHAPSSYVERLDRALHQRMFVLDRVRSTSPENPSEELTMAGTTGNLYTVTVGRVPQCTCPDNQKGNQCKHIVYALVRVLKAPAQLQYQLAFLSAELTSMFAAAPLPTEAVSAEDADADHPNNRKPVAGDCPICFCDMADDDPKDIVWCKTACGNNIHKACFNRWARTSRDSGGKTRCVYCRADWAGEAKQGPDGQWAGDKTDLEMLRANASVGEDGYANVAEELGLDPERDTSTYYRPWQIDYGGRSTRQRW